MTGEARVRRLFFALAVLYVLPFWTVRYLPTVDGPSHTYNAWILVQHGNAERYPLLSEHYRIDLRPHPNWIGHGALALFMLAVPPLVAEKLVVSGYVLLFLGGAWYLAGAVRPGEERWPAFLAFPFACHQLFQFGFYNFSIGLALYLFAVGFWWRHRGQPGLAFAVKINLLLVVCWLSHILSFGVSLLSIAVLWLVTLRKDNWRTWLRHIPILAPQLAFPAWFLSVHGRNVDPGRRSFGELLDLLVPPKMVHVFGFFESWLAVAVAVAFLVLGLLTLRRGLRPVHEPADAFLLLGVALTAVYFVSPEGGAGGTGTPDRLSLFLYLALIPWLSPRLGRRGTGVALAGLVLLAVVNLGSLFYGVRALGRDVERFVAGFALVRPNSRVFTIRFPTDSHAARANVLSHATAYAALEKGLVDWDNYEAKFPYFPVQFRPSVNFPDVDGVIHNAGALRIWGNRSRVDVYYFWGMPPGHALERRLSKSQYRLVAKTGEGALYERRPRRPGSLRGRNAGARPPRVSKGGREVFRSGEPVRLPVDPGGMVLTQVAKAAPQVWDSPPRCGRLPRR
jgi:hypothetical protein